MIPRITAAIMLVSALAALPAAGLLTLLAPGRHIQFFVAFFISIGAILAFGVFEHRSAIFGSIFWKGLPGQNRVALTFDDGPNEPFTGQVIEILRTNRISATFFVIGKNARKFPGTLKRLADEGFEIGNHGWSHEVLPLKTPATIREEISKTSDLIRMITGRRPSLFRAPHGWRNPWVNRVARELGCTPVAWSLGIWDTDRPGFRAIVDRVLKGARDGTVLLLHDGRGIEDKADSSQLIQALPDIIAALKQRGFRFVTLSQMMDSEAR